MIAVLVVLTPIGLILPAYFKAGAAWGEWGIDEIRKLIGYVPKGLEKFSNVWVAIMPDYGASTAAYVISAVLGIFVITGLIFLIGKVLVKKE